MNDLKPYLQTTVKTLLGKGISQREINRKTGVDRKTIRKYGRLDGHVAGHCFLQYVSIFSNLSQREELYKVKM